MNGLRTDLNKLLIAVLFFCGVTALQAKGGETFNFGAVLSHHLNDAVIWEFAPGAHKVRPGNTEFAKSPTVGGVLNMKDYIFRDEKGIYKYRGGLQLHITKRVFMMWVVSFFLILVMVTAGRIIARNPFRITSRFAGLMETMIQFIRVDVVDKNMHGHHGKGFEPYILSLFFFILFSNLFGLIPPFGEVISEFMHLGGKHVVHQVGDKVPVVVGLWSGTTVTGDVNVTLALAIITVIMIWITGFRYQGVKFIWSFLPHGFPKIMAIIMYPILWVLLFVLEIIVGPIAKGIALTIRLLANMTAGHVIILALIGFIFQFGYFAAMFSIPGAAAIYMLEILVAFLQAFIFALLTAIFIGSTMEAH